MSKVQNVSKRRRFWWLPWRLVESNRLGLDQLQRYGLTDTDRRDFELACRSGLPTPPWVADRMIEAADAARAAGEVPAE